MGDSISKLLTFWIPIKSIRKKTRSNLQNYLYCNSKKYKNMLKEVIKILEKEIDIYATVSIKFFECLYQRPQHIATQIANKDYLFLYAHDGGNENTYYRNGNILFVDKNIFDFLPDHLTKKINILVPSTSHYFTFEKLVKYRKKGYNIFYDYIDDLHEDISGNIKEQLNTFNNLEKINPTCIISTAKNLYQQMLNRFPKEKVFLIPNGVDIKNFENIPNIVPDDMLDIVSQCKPIIGYYGAMAPWINWDLLNKLAIKCNDYNFVYIGIDYGNSLKNLKIFDNVHFLGPKNYTELPQYAQYFTCCMIPFQEGEIAKSTNPLKLFEYMALQKPTVCTKDLLECYGYDGVFIAENCEDFSEKLKLAIKTSKDEKIKNQLLNYALNNTWEKRAISIININKGKCK